MDDNLRLNAILQTLIIRYKQDPVRSLFPIQQPSIDYRDVKVCF